MARPKQAQVKEVLSLRLPDERRSALQREAETRDAGVSDVIRTHLDRYAEIEWRDLPKLSESDWCAVFEALGSVPLDVAAVAWVGTTVARALEDGALARKWKIDPDLVATASAWTFGQACAVADAAGRFHRVLAEGTKEATEAARQATTRPATLVLAPPRREPARRGQPPARRARR